MHQALLSNEQRSFFEEFGYLTIEDALPPEMTERLLRRSMDLYARGRAERALGPSDFWDMRNCIGSDAAFLELLDWPATFPLVVDLLGWNLELSTSHLTVLPPALPGTDARPRAGWHRDGGTSPGEMKEPHPRLWIKIAYWLTDTRHPESGAMRLVPGSNRLIGKPATMPGEDDPVGTIDLRVKAGTAVLFEQRTWHSRGCNFSSAHRVGVFIGYSYRWIRPMDYLQMPAELLERCSPIQRQLLGEAKTQMGYYLPTDEDVPLRAWAEARQSQPTEGH